MGDGNSFPLVVCVFEVILAFESIVLCKCSGKYIDIYFIMKITCFYWRFQCPSQRVVKFHISN